MKNIVWLFLVVSGLVLSCSKMEDQHLKYVKGGELHAVGAPYNVVVTARTKGVIVSFEKTADPGVIKYIISWSEGKNSMEVIPTSSRIENIEIPNLASGSYSFELIAVDAKGNKSKTAYGVGVVQ
ncbi:DUF4998 domain-containing protein [Pedobacter frigoris]|uniref:DUF4998 domain-containing protein n=1 Tax=Pedobacter frigoris TaxID=2571272 RepID=UPI00292EEB53|nr:DUF4998 domain-containing protein [Pedobacter frigoris]